MKIVKQMLMAKLKHIEDQELKHSQALERLEKDGRIIRQKLTILAGREMKLEGGVN